MKPIRPETFGRTRQCAKCPWKVDTDPTEIPDGYSVDKHRALIRCQSDGLHDAGTMMACHESPASQEQACVGWLDNQLGPGNNLSLRWLALEGLLDGSKLQIFGEQHPSLEAMVGAATGVDLDGLEPEEI